MRTGRGAEEHIIDRIGRTIDDGVSNRAKLHRAPVVHADNGVRQIVGRLEGIASLNTELLIAGGEVARLHTRVGGLQALRNSRRSK